MDAGRVLSEAEHSVLFPSLPAQQEHACFQGSSGGVWREESAVTGGGRIWGVGRHGYGEKRVQSQGVGGSLGWQGGWRVGARGTLTSLPASGS